MTKLARILAVMFKSIGFERVDVTVNYEEDSPSSLTIRLSSKDNLNIRMTTEMIDPEIITRLSMCDEMLFEFSKGIFLKICSGFYDGGYVSARTSVVRGEDI